MEKELVQLFETVKKAADTAARYGGADLSPEEDRCLDALKKLKEIPVNYDVLVSTQVGKRLRQMTNHPRKRIRALASDVVEIWKGIIVKETAKIRKNGNTKLEDSVKAESGVADSEGRNKVGRVNSVKISIKAKPAGADSDIGCVKVERVSTAGAVDVESFDRYFSSNSEKAKKIGTLSTRMKVERTSFKAGKSSLGGRIKEKIAKEVRKTEPAAPTTPEQTAEAYTKDQMRDKMRQIFAEALCKVATEVDGNLREEVDASDPYKVATMVENAIFEKLGKSNGAQKRKYRSILFNIKDPKNPDFRRKVLLGHFPPRSIIYLSSEDMASDARQKQIEEIRQKALSECEREGPPEATTEAFKCGRCGKRETTYYQQQTRRADEPMTTFITCVNCNKRWKS